MGLNQDLIGKEYDASTFAVTADHIERYARATNDENERYLGGDDVVAPPVFPVVAAFDSFAKSATDPELGADLLRLVHGAQEHVLLRPLRPGDVLTVNPVLESVEQKDTGETFTTKATLSAQDGTPVAEVRGTMFIRGTSSGKKPRVAQTEEPARDIVYEESTKVDDDQTQRYAEASGDHNPIHLDENVARMAGLPRTILHGMCSMAIATKAAVNGLAGGDPTRIKRVGVRLSKPVFPGQELTTKLWQEADGDDATVYGFETYNPDGAAVIKAGVVEIANT